MENNLVLHQSGGEMALTARDIRAQVNLIQEVMKAVMKKDVHYGIIPGCPKPSLFKAGAEKIAATFRIAVKSEVEDLSTLDEKHFRVTCTGTSPGGAILGSAVGECSSSEEKFKWRSPVCDQEFEECDVDRKREKWVKGFGNAPAYKKKQIRTEPSDLANTILQLADKRAYVAVVRKITAASDVFTQDIEDLPAEIQSEIVDQQPPEPKPPVQEPKKKEAPPAAPANGNVISEPQAKRLYAIAKGKGYEDQDIKDYLLENYGIDSSRQIQREHYEDICSAFQVPKVKDE